MANTPPHSLVSDKMAQVKLYTKNTSNDNQQSTFFVHNSSPWSVETLNDLLDTFVTWWTTDIAPVTNSLYSLVRLSATDITSSQTPLVDRILAAAIPGTLVGQALPPNCTYAVKASIGQRGRGRAGRVFFPGLTVTQVLNDSLTGAAETAILAAFNALITAIAGTSGWELQVLHRIINKIWQPVQTGDPVTAFVGTDPYLDSQRDRLPGHKRHKKAATVVPPP